MATKPASRSIAISAQGRSGCKFRLGVHNVLVTCEVTGGGPFFTKAPLKQELIKRDGFSDFRLDFVFLQGRDRRD